MRSKHKISVIILISFAASFILYIGFWFGTAFLLENAAKRAINNWQEHGYTIRIVKSEKRNFPFPPQLILQDISISSEQEGWFSYIEEIDFTSSLFGLAPGYRLDIQNSAATLANGNVIAIKSAHIEGNFLPSSLIADRSKMTLTATDIDLPMKWGFSNHIDQIEISGYLDKDLDLPLSKAQMQLWRDSGGALQIEEFFFQQQELSLRGNMTLALDQEMQPLAAGVVTGSGLDQLIDQLVFQEKLKPMAGLLIKQLITQVKGSSNGITSALSIQSNYLYLDAQRVIKLPSIIWPN